MAPVTSQALTTMLIGIKFSLQTGMVSLGVGRHPAIGQLLGLKLLCVDYMRPLMGAGRVRVPCNEALPCVGES